MRSLIIHLEFLHLQKHFIWKEIQKPAIGNTWRLRDRGLRKKELFYKIYYSIVHTY